MEYTVSAYRDGNKYMDPADTLVSTDIKDVERWVRRLAGDGCDRFEMNAVDRTPPADTDKWIHPGFYCVADESSHFEFVTKNVLGMLKENENYRPDSN